jgi:lipopolysaccharide export system permease protein
MFTTIDRLLIFNYFKAYAFCLVSLMGLFIVVDLFLNLEDFTSNRKGFTDVLAFVGTYYGYKSFQIFDRLCEPVVLLAGMFTVAWMQRNNELLPLLSAGVSTRRAVQPVLLCAGTMMGLVALNQEFGLPSVDSFMLENRKNPDGAQETDVKGTYDMERNLLSGDKAVRKELLVKKFIAIIPPRGTRNSIITLQAKEATYIPERADVKLSGGWHLKQTRAEDQVETDDSDDILRSLGGGEYFLKTKDGDFDSVVRVKNWFMYLPTWKLLKELDRPGNMRHAELAVAFHGRMTRPVIGIILILMGLSVILRDQNRNVFVGAGLCLMLCVIFFAAIFTCQWLGKDESMSRYISPALAAWLPVIVFGPCALVMYDAVHT